MEPATPLSVAVVPLLYYAYPAAVFVYFLGSSLVAACTLQRLKDDSESQKQHPSRRVVIGILAGFLLTYLAQLAALISCCLVNGRWPPTDYLVVGALSCLLVFVIQLSWLADEDISIGYPLYGSWALSLVFEVVIVILTAVKVDAPTPITYDVAETSFAAARCALLLLIGLISWRASSAQEIPAAPDEERQLLLPKVGDAAASQGGSGAAYGTTSQSDQSSGNAAEYNWERREREAREAMEKRLREGGNWFQYSKGFLVSLPSR